MALGYWGTGRRNVGPLPQEGLVDHKPVPTAFAQDFLCLRNGRPQAVTGQELIPKPAWSESYLSEGVSVRSLPMSLCSAQDRRLARLDSAHQHRLTQQNHQVFPAGAQGLCGLPIHTQGFLVSDIEMSSKKLLDRMVTLVTGAGSGKSDYLGSCRASDGDQDMELV